jgi:aryl-alcohol dehydrogenase-like predicted oxidoreductase
VAHERRVEGTFQMISKLTLGTAQLGQQYGIANITGKPSERAAYEMLSIAFSNGINCIDTAPIYGDSEYVIGSYLRKHPKRCTVVTKLPHCNFENGHSFKEVYPIVKSWVSTSLNNLRQDKIDTYLVRDVSQLDIIYDSLRKLKMERLIGKIGVSVYDVKELNQSLKYDEIEVFQLPINLFDHRFIPHLPKLKGKTVFARSIFLQGLFFTPTDYCPMETEKHISNLTKICEDFETNIREVAVSFARDLPNITSLVIGAEMTTQVLDNIDLIESPKLPDNLRNYIYKEFADMPLEVIDPRRWK